MALSDIDKFVYIKEPASGIFRFSIDSNSCVSFAFSQRLKIEVFLNSVDSSHCQTEEKCVYGDQERSNLGHKSDNNSSVVEAAEGFPSQCDEGMCLETGSEIGLISDDEKSSGGVTCFETSKMVNRQSKNSQCDEKLNQESENILISVDEISSGHVTCFETSDRVSVQNKSDTRKAITDTNIPFVPFILIKTNVSTKTKNKVKDRNGNKKMKLKKLSLRQTSTNKLGSATHKSGSATNKSGSATHKSSSATSKSGSGTNKSGTCNIKLTGNANKFVVAKLSSKKQSKSQATCEVSCPHCLSVFHTQQDFYDHKKTARVDSFQCKYCPKMFPFDAFLQAHTKTYHSKIGGDSGKEFEGFKCDFCCVETKTLFSFKKHLMFHTEEYYYKCCICGKQFVELGTLKNHMTTHRSGGMIRCTCCDQLFATRGALGKHKVALMELKCHLCGETFPNKTSRTQHYKQFHQTDILKCVECTSLFSSQQELSAHMKYHTMCKKKQCTICGKLFSRLEKHIITHKSESELDESLLFVCDKCPRKFSNRSSFQRHLSIHSSDKPYRCPNCPKTFADCGSLRRHLKRHSSLMPYQCEVCGKKCKESGNLRVHMRIHSDKKHFPCPLCPQAFNYKTSLEGHMKNRHPANKASSDPVSGHSSDCPNVYDNTVAQVFTPGRVIVPGAQHVDGSFMTGEHGVTSSCLQHQFSKQPELMDTNLYESTGNPMAVYEGKKASYGLLSAHVFDIPALQSLEGNEDHATKHNYSVEVEASCLSSSYIESVHPSNSECQSNNMSSSASSSNVTSLNRPLF